MCAKLPRCGAEATHRPMTGRLVSIARKAKPHAPVEELRTAIISAAAGVEGDFRGRPGPRQITILFAEDWKAAVANLDPSAPWTIRRANLLVEGIPNPKAPGGILAIGGALFLVTGQTTPCSRMEAQLAGLREALKPDWRGGLTAQAMSDVEIAVGDEACWQSAAS
jgi:MOSC domain-containing protein YiiM